VLQPVMASVSSDFIIAYSVGRGRLKARTGEV
jgi:hypothetical protein